MGRSLCRQRVQARDGRSWYHATSHSLDGELALGRLPLQGAEVTIRTAQGTVASGLVQLAPKLPGVSPQSDGVGHGEGVDLKTCARPICHTLATATPPYCKSSQRHADFHRAAVLQSLASCRYLDGQFCPGIGGVALFTISGLDCRHALRSGCLEANAAGPVLVSYTVRLAGEGVSEHNMMGGGLYDDATGVLLHPISGASAEVRPGGPRCFACRLLDTSPGNWGHCVGSSPRSEPHRPACPLLSMLVAVCGRATSQDVTGTWRLPADQDELRDALTALAARQISLRLFFGAKAVQASVNAAPLYVPSPRTAVISETAAAGTLVCANDPSRPFALAAGPVRYRLLDGDDGRFGIDASSGAVTVRQTGTAVLNYNVKSLYTLRVQAADDASGRVDVAAVHVEVADENNNPPLFEQERYFEAVAENAPPGTVVATIRATDADANFPALSYRMEPPSDASAATPFRVDTTTTTAASGVEAYEATITSTGPLDYEADRSYLLRVLASDGVNREADTTVVISVLDVNDHAPRFVGTNITCSSGGAGGSMCRQGGVVLVPEDMALGTDVAVVSVLDQDSGRNSAVALAWPSRYIAGCDPRASSLLRLEMQTAPARAQTPGEEPDAQASLLLARPLDYETAPLLTVCVAARDGGAPARETVLVITVRVTDVTLRLALSPLSASPSPLGSRRGAVYFLAEGTLDAVVRANSEAPPADSIAMEYVVDGDLPASDCHLSAWSDAGPCRLLLEDGLAVGGTCIPRGAAATAAKGRRAQVRHVVRLRDVYGQGADCPRVALDSTTAAELSFIDPQLAEISRPGMVLAARVSSCDISVCSESPGVSDRGPTALSTDELESLRLMNQLPRNGFLRNHPEFDDWSVNASWQRRDAWGGQARQALSHTAAAFAQRGGQAWRTCPATGEALSCSVQGTLWPGPHTVGVRLLNRSSNVPLAELLTSVLVDEDSPQLSVPDPRWTRCGPTVGGQSGCDPVAVNSAAVEFSVLQHRTGPSHCDAACFDPLPGQNPLCDMCRDGAPVHYRCRLDDAIAFSPCPLAAEGSGSAVLPPDGFGARLRFANLGHGHHVLRVIASDAAGNNVYGPLLPPATIQWLVANQPPQTILLSWPANRITTSDSASFSFACTEPPCEYRCRLDTTAGNCDAAVAYKGLSAGLHQFGVTAVDRAGNADPTPATFSWRVLQRQPKLRFTTLPGTVVPQSVSASSEWRVHVAADRDVAGLLCRLSSAEGTQAAECCAALLGRDHPCASACARGLLFGNGTRGAACSSAWSRADLVDARLRYSTCVQSQAAAREPLPGGAGGGAAAGWAACSSPVDLRGFQHGFSYRFEVAVDHGSSEPGPAPLRWEWTTDVMYLPPRLLRQVQGEPAQQPGGALCPSVSTALTATLTLAWSLAAVALLGPALLHLRREWARPGVKRSAPVGQRQAGDLGHALEMIHLADMSAGPDRGPAHRGAGGREGHAAAETALESATDSVWSGEFGSFRPDDYGDGAESEPEGGDYI